jgi:hypothetical protein
LLKGGIDMAIAIENNDICSIYEGLKYNFLYKNDINCIHILLNLYDLEDNITNICPKYISVNNLKKHIGRLLKGKNSNHLISLNLGQLIHEDINRLELYIYLEGYKQGYFNNKWVNTLEKATVENIIIEELYNIKYLYHFDTSEVHILDIKSSLTEEIQEEEKHGKFLNNIIGSYCDNIIKPKVLNLNKFLDKQLKIEYDSTMYNIQEDNSLLTLVELNNIYKEIVKIILKDGLKLYGDAYWYGLNDRVLKRYR